MILVSSCLCGINCKYNGKNNFNSFVFELVNKGLAIPLCAEQLGGLTTPRVPAEIINNKVIDKNGNDVTEQFTNGANTVAEICKTLNIKTAILKSKSPSCGVGKVYDGSFSGKLIDKNGITAQLLINIGIKVFTENQIDELINYFKIERTLIWMLLT